MLKHDGGGEDGESGAPGERPLRCSLLHIGGNDGGSSVLVSYWSEILILAVVVICGMIFFGTLGMLVTGQSLRVAIESGFTLTQVGEFSFIIASLGMSLGVLEPSLYPIIVAVSVITIFTTPYFVKALAACLRIRGEAPSRETQFPHRQIFKASDRLERDKTALEGDTEPLRMAHTPLLRGASRHNPRVEAIPLPAHPSVHGGMVADYSHCHHVRLYASIPVCPIVQFHKTG